MITKEDRFFVVEHAYRGDSSPIGYHQVESVGQLYFTLTGIVGERFLKSTLKHDSNYQRYRLYASEQEYLRLSSLGL